MSNDNQIECKHVRVVDLDIKGNTKGCEECKPTSSDWVH